MKKINIILAIAAAALTVSCEKEIDFESKVGTTIQFGASTGYDNGPATRTEYSGKDENNRLVQSTSQYERIDWVANTDRISILCNEVPGSTKILDYKITSATAASQNSIAEVAPVDEQFNWGTGEHYFFAMYPAPSQTGVTAGEAVLNDNGNHTVTISGKIPATQSVTLSGREYKANMNYAYMYAAKKVDSPESDVELGFKPLVTAFEFTLLADNTFPITSNLTSVELSSSSTNLAGSFTATVNENGLSGNPTISGGTKKLTLNLGTGIQLSKTDPTKFTFLALPVQQTNLTLKLTFNNGETRSLELKKDNSFITVAACKKVYIKSVGVMPEVIYHLEVQAPDAHETIESTGGSKDYKVISYLEYKSDTEIIREPVPWTATFVVNNGTNWNTNPSGWTVPNPRGSGSTTGETRSATANQNTTTEDKSWHGPTSDLASSTADAIDLSLKNYKGEDINQSTANCYVVNAPGWYKIPLVYGNAITNGKTIESSYKNSNSGSNMLKNFIRHDGQAIKGPWITTDNNITVDGAVLCWQDCDAFSTSDANKPRIIGNYLYFRVRSGNRIKQGNAVIAATSGGTIVWSWHIWIMESSKFDPMMIGTNKMMNMNLGWADADKTIPERILRIKVKQETSGKEEIVEIHQNAGDVFGGNVFYQWGRKDPMLGADGHYKPMPQSGSKQWSIYNMPISWDTKTPPEPDSWYYLAEGTIFQTGPWYNGALVHNNGVVTVNHYYFNTPFADAIKNPNLFFAPERTVNDVPNGYDGYDLHTNLQYYGKQGYTSINPVWKQFYDGKWYSGRYLNLWNANAVYDTNNTVVKTVYDPSPAGWKVANRNAFDALTSRPITNLGWGYAVKTTDGKRMTFPRIALREMHGNLRSQDYSGENEVFIWTASIHPYSQSVYSDSGDYLQWSSLGGNTAPQLHVDLGPEAYGMSVRPIEDPINNY